MNQENFIERLWIIVAALGAVVALIFLWRGKADGAFVAGALGLLAWFLSVRVRLTKANPVEERASKMESHDAEGLQDED